MNINRVIVISLIFIIYTLIGCSGEENIPVDPPPTPTTSPEDQEMPINTPSEGGGYCTYSQDQKYLAWVTLSDGFAGTYRFLCYAGATKIVESNEVEYTKLFFNEGTKDKGKALSIQYKSGSGSKKVGTLTEGADAEVTLYTEYKNGPYTTSLADNQDAIFRVVDTAIEGEKINIYLENVKLKWKLDNVLIKDGEIAIPRAKDSLELANYRTCECSFDFTSQ